MLLLTPGSKAGVAVLTVGKSTACGGVEIYADLLAPAVAKPWIPGALMTRPTMRALRREPCTFLQVEKGQAPGVVDVIPG